MKRLIKISLLIVFLLVYSTIYSQTDTINTADSIEVFAYSFQPDTWLYHMQGAQFAKEESTIGIMPSIQGFNELYLGLGIAKARFFMGEGVGAGYGTTLGFEYNPLDNIFAPKITQWYTFFAYIIGFNAGISGYYYMNTEPQNTFVIRPEIGLGFYKVYFNYGYNISLNKNYNNISKHTFTMSFYYTILPPKKNN